MHFRLFLKFFLDVRSPISTLRAPNDDINQISKLRKNFFKEPFLGGFSGLVTKNPEKGQTVSKYDFLSKYFILTEKHSCLFSFLSAICLQFVSYLFTISQLFVYISSAIYYISSAVCLHFISCLFTFFRC